jgi:Zn finger protein HypA/HybF involved in hydrogenase expression
MNMTINFKCPHCQATLQAVNNLAGKPGLCPKCNKEISVPQETQTKSEEKETTNK